MARKLLDILAFLFAGPLVELAWWLFTREPHWIQTPPRSSLAWGEWGEQ